MNIGNIGSTSYPPNKLRMHALVAAVSMKLYSVMTTTQATRADGRKSNLVKIMHYSHMRRKCHLKRHNGQETDFDSQQIAKNRLDSEFFYLLSFQMEAPDKRFALQDGLVDMGDNHSTRIACM